MKHPMGVFGTAVVFFATDDSSWITGESLIVGGGIR
jgi:NAD(P)-dependent dehydrogenase (short-subunit alcohol dehydrogenase family)